MVTTETRQDNKRYAKRKSVALSGEELKSLKKFAKQFTTATEAAEQLGMSPQVMNRIILVGSGSPESISLIRQKLGTAA